MAMPTDSEVNTSSDGVHVRGMRCMCLDVCVGKVWRTTSVTLTHHTNVPKLLFHLWCMTNKVYSNLPPPSSAFASVFSMLALDVVMPNTRILDEERSSQPPSLGRRTLCPMLISWSFGGGCQLPRNILLAVLFLSFCRSHSSSSHISTKGIPHISAEKGSAGRCTASHTTVHSLSLSVHLAVIGCYHAIFFTSTTLYTLQNIFYAFFRLWATWGLPLYSSGGNLTGWASGNPIPSRDHLMWCNIPFRCDMPRFWCWCVVSLTCHCTSNIRAEVALVTRIHPIKND